MVKKNDHFGSQSGVPKRKINERQEQALLTISFKDMDLNQCPPGQTLLEWEDEKMLSKLMKKFIDVCSKTVMTLEREEQLCLYGSFPKNSEFRMPAKFEGENLNWGTIRNIGGQKPRLAGYLKDNTFYCVFLDSEHKFYPSEKKHT